MNIVIEPTNYEFFLLNYIIKFKVPDPLLKIQLSLSEKDHLKDWQILDQPKQLSTNNKKTYSFSYDEITDSPTYQWSLDINEHHFQLDYDRVMIKAVSDVSYR